jgi:NitT/TauT family transport system substrate-binding protein
MRWWGGARRHGSRGTARAERRFVVLGVVLLLAACSGGSPAAPAPAARTGAAQSPAAGSAPAAAPAAAPLVPMQVGYGAITASYIPLYIAAEMKAWEKYGLDVELVHLPGNTGPQSLLAGQVPLMALSGFASAPSMIEGADFVIFGTMIPRHTARIYGVYGLDTPQALRGKRLGVTRLGTLTHFGALVAMREWGLEPDKDVALVSMNESANILAGMISGAVDAGVLTDPNSFAAQKAGYPLLVDLVDWPVDSNSAGFTTTRSFLQQNRPQLVSFLRGYMEGHKRFFEDRAYSIDVLRKYARIDDPEVLDSTYALYVEKYFVKVPLPTVAGLQNIFDDYAEVNPRAKGIDAAPMVDPSLVQDLQREGFFRQLGLE